jgi:hypothetical protein
MAGTIDMHAARRRHHHRRTGRCLNPHLVELEIRRAFVIIAHPNNYSVLHPPRIDGGVHGKLIINNHEPFQLTAVHIQAESLPIGDLPNAQRHEGAAEKIRRLVIARCGNDLMSGKRKRSSRDSIIRKILADLSDSWPMWLFVHRHAVLFYRQIQALEARGHCENKISKMLENG